MHLAEQVQVNLTESLEERQSGEARCIVHDLAFDGEKTPATSKGDCALCQPIVIAEKSEACRGPSDMVLLTWDHQGK